MFLVFVLFSLAGSTSQPRGIDPANLRFYQQSEFSCIDGSKTFSSLNVVNDDYCDCPDGSDEPGTSACHNGVFYCVNGGHVPQSIFSSRVNDGICDCCDGSDEYTSGKCRNTCKEAWEEATKQIRAEIAEHDAGLAFLKQKQAEHEQNTIQKKIQLEEKKSLKSVLQPKINDLTTTKDELQSKINQKTDELKSSLSAIIEEEVNREFETAQLEKLKALEESQKEPQTEEQPLPHEQPGWEQLEQQEQQATEDYVITDHDHDHVEQIPSESKPELTEEEKQKQLEDEKQAIRSRLTDQKIAENDELKGLKEELRQLEDNLNNLNREKEDLDRSIDDIEKFLSFDFGPSARFAYLNDASISYNAPEYTYTLNTFKEVTQGHTRVGSWGQWRNNYRELYFDRGERCWGGPDRSMVVTLQCGSSNVILGVQEPAKCEYHMQLRTPGACEESNLAELKAKLSPRN